MPNQGTPRTPLSQYPSEPWPLTPKSYTPSLNAQGPIYI